MAKRIEVVLPNQEFRRLEQVAAAAGMEPAEIARLALRRVMADPAWLRADAKPHTQEQDWLKMWLKPFSRPELL